MATLLSWTSVGIGDLDIFVPSPPCLVVYTSYIDDKPESSVTYFWQDESTGALNHELVYQQPVSFDTAVAWAQEHAPTRSVERIHVKHARAKKAVEPKARAKPVARRGCGEEGAGEEDSGKEDSGKEGGSREEIAGSQRAKEESFRRRPFRTPRIHGEAAASMDGGVTNSRLSPTF